MKKFHLLRIFGFILYGLTFEAIMPSAFGSHIEDVDLLEQEAMHKKLTSPQEFILESPLAQEDKELLLLAVEASKNAYSPFSGYHVGCALKTQQGNIFTGCNVENDSYGLGICSERNALTTAVAQEGPDMQLKTLAAIVIDKEGRIVKENGSTCGACRQFMAQFGVDAHVIYVYKNQFHKNTLEELLLNPFVIIHNK